MKKSILLLGFFLMSLGIHAQSGLSHQNKICLKQTKRIKQGKKDRNLTRKEVKQLNKQKRNLKKTVRVAKADGVITNDERKVIAKKHHKLSRNIFRKKHNTKISRR